MLRWMQGHQALTCNIFPSESRVSMQSRRGNVESTTCSHDDKANVSFHSPSWCFTIQYNLNWGHLDTGGQNRVWKVRTAAQARKTTHNHGNVSKAMREKPLFHSTPQFQTFLYLKAICFHLITATSMSAPASTCHTQRDIHILQPKIFFKVCVVYMLNDSDNSPRHHSQPPRSKKEGGVFTPVFEQTSQFTYAELQYHSARLNCQSESCSFLPKST